MKVITILILSIYSLSAFNQTPEELNSFKRKVLEGRDKAVNELKENYKYDGNSITYFFYKTEDQVKSIEVFMFSPTNYILNFDAELVPETVNIKIYDAPSTETNRNLVYQKKQVKKQVLQVTSDELNTNLKAIDTSYANLKRVFIEYQIPSNPEHVKASKGTIDGRGAVILSLSYQNPSKKKNRK